MEFSPEEIIAHRFDRGRRKGYDTLEVDGFLERLAVHVGRLQDELARHQATERTALKVLQQAHVVADETVASAQREAAEIRQNASCGLENARKDARGLLDSARAEADRTLLTARVQAEAALDRARAKVAELDAAGVARTREFDRIHEELRVSAERSIGELRSAGLRLLEIAEHLECEPETRGEQLGADSEEPIDREEASVDLRVEHAEVR